MILATAMAKFIWVAELGTKETFKGKDKKANGIIILDATGANTKDLKPLILAAHNGELTTFDPETNELVRIKLNWQSFLIYENLKH